MEKICEIEDEQIQIRAIRRYVFELENKISSYETESSNHRKENYDMRKNILSSKIVENEIQKARDDEWRKYNTDWSGMQEGF